MVWERNAQKAFTKIQMGISRKEEREGWWEVLIIFVLLELLNFLFFIFIERIYNEMELLQAFLKSLII